MIRYASVCDGISAVSVAWAPLGWECAWCSEIDPFASAVLAERWPGHENVGDMLAIDERIRDRGPIDVLVGGTPCQSFSVAGLRGGLDDPRGNLALRFCQLAGLLRPKWVVWENVPGVLSSVTRAPDCPPPDRVGVGPGEQVVVEEEYDEVSAFASILNAFRELGYGFAYRVLDAQFFGVPQRRRRVFVVGCFGDWRSAAAVLFDRESLRGDSPKGGKTRASVAGALTRRIDRGGVNSEGHDNQLIPVAALTANGVGTCGAGDNQAQGGHLIAATLNGGMGRRRGSGQHGDGLVAATVTCRPYGDGDEAAGRLVAFSAKNDGGDCGDVAPTLRSMNHHGSHANAGGQVAVAYQCHGTNVRPMGTLRKGNGNETGGVPFLPLAIDGRARGDDGRGYGRPEHVTEGVVGTLDATKPHRVLAGPRLAVRRLTPRECERLQGFEPDYTLVTYRKKPAADGPRYRAIGNSMAVPVMRWIGERIAAVDKIGGAS